MNSALQALVDAAGLVPNWTDFEGRPRQVPEQTLRAVLGRLELPCASDAQCRDSLALLQHERSKFAPLTRDGELPVSAPGRCFALTDLVGERRLWGLSAQLYSLRRDGDGGLGDFTALAQLAAKAAQLGADAIAISPVHALFAAEPQRYGPYSPSSRLFLNHVYADPAAVFGEDAVRTVARHTAQADSDLIDWPAAARSKLAVLRELYRRLPQTAKYDEFKQFCAAGDPALHAHAAFETLHAHFVAHDAAACNWQDWPTAFHDPDGKAVAEFLREHQSEFAFHQFLQWISEVSFAAAQAAARAAGMAIGVIGDLAVGTDGGGSHAWSRQRDMLSGLALGAPPDALNAQGQNWGLTTFSPRALERTGFAPFIELVRAVFRNVGGLRIDHVFGLQRLWLVPHGAEATEGVYLNYPRETLYALLARESWRNRAIVVGEDLGTVPDGFRDGLRAAGLLGLRTLWFERDHGLFVDPSRWPREVAAMTSSHDVATVAGWWRGRDLDWRARLGLLPGDEASQRQQRVRDRQALWDAFLHAGVATGAPPPSGVGVPAAAAAFVARTPSRLALLAVEDALGLEEQVNIPGTTDTHPNWRRRLAVTTEQLLDQPAATASVQAMRRERPRA